MATKRLTPDLTKKFYNYMLNKYDATTINKSDAWEMQLIGHSLDLMNIQDQKVFLNNYSTTIGNKIYLPFKPGSDDLPLHLQVENLVHELHHVRQWREDPKFALRYLVSDTDRAHYEAEAYSTNLEIHWWYCGKLYNTTALAEKLKNYSIGSADIKVVAKSLKVHSYMVRQGGVYREVSKTAIKWLNTQLGRRRRSQ